MLTQEEFEQIVVETIQQLPERFRRLLDEANIVIGIKDSPDIHDPPDFVRKKILGFYHGVPMHKRLSTGLSTFPDRIVIYKSMLEASAKSPSQIRELLRKVVLHEIGHFFGLSETELRKIGY